MFLNNGGTPCPSGRVPRWVMGWIDAGLASAPTVDVGAEYGHMHLALMLFCERYQ
jgi:hypothetical protein